MTGPLRRRRFPAWLRPLMLDGHVHADGGVFASALFPFDTAHFERLALRVHVRMRMIVNLRTHAAVLAANPASAGDMRNRSSLVTSWWQQQLLERLDLLARDGNAGVPACR